MKAGPVMIACKMTKLFAFLSLAHSTRRTETSHWPPPTQCTCIATLLCCEPCNTMHWLAAETGSDWLLYIPSWVGWYIHVLDWQLDINSTVQTCTLHFTNEVSMQLLVFHSDHAQRWWHPWTDRLSTWMLAITDGTSLHLLTCKNGLVELHVAISYHVCNSVVRSDGVELW